MKNPDTVMKELELGFIPNELSFSLPVEGEECEIDWSALNYNEYDSFDFWCGTHLPEGLLEQWPCLEDWARDEYKSRERRTPLEDIEIRRQGCLEEQALEIGEISLQDNINNVYTEELSRCEN